MSRYNSYGNLDSYGITDGDVTFTGVDTKHDRSTLPPGMLAYSVNTRLWTGRAETRPGSVLPTNYNPAYAANIWGAGGTFVYSNPNGPEVVLVGTVGANYVWKLQDGVAPSQLTLPAGRTLDQQPWFVQAFDKVLLLITGETPLVWDGIAAGFVNITKFDPTDTSTLLIPNVGYGISFQSRVLYVNGRDQILMSDILDYTSYDPILGSFRINAGESDQIGAIAPFNNQSVIIFMQKSIHRLSNFTLDPSLAVQEVVTRQLGLVPGTGGNGRKAWVQVGGDIHFLSNPGGIYRLSQVWEQLLQGQPVPISDNIQPWIDNIDWDPTHGVGGTTAQVYGKYAYWALAVKPWPNTHAIYVYNTITGQWETADFQLWNNTPVTDLIVTSYQGQRRLFAAEGYVKALRLLEETTVLTDQIPGGTTVAPIAQQIETRGYGIGSAAGPGSLYGIQRASGPGSIKRFDRLFLSLRTQNPNFAVYALTQGYQEVKQLVSGVTKDPTKFYTWGTPPSAVTPDPKRQDYTGYTDPGPPQVVNPKQESLERMPVRTIGRWVSFRITNQQGACDVVQISVDGHEIQRVTRVAA